MTNQDIAVLVAHAHCVQNITHPEAALPWRSPRIHHPDEGWGTITVINRIEFQVRFGDRYFAWFSLTDPTVAQWDIENAATFTRWARRVQGGE